MIIERCLAPKVDGFRVRIRGWVPGLKHSCGVAYSSGPLVTATRLQG